MDFNRRYAVEEQERQEIVLLMGRGCFYKKCTFCDYHFDCGPGEVSVPLNERVLDQVTGTYNRLVVLNSGSYFELPAATRERIIILCREKGITELFMESHWLLRDQTAALKNELAQEGIALHPRIGIETFDEKFREEVLVKGMGCGVTPAEIAEIYDECCLLFGLAGQSLAQFDRDLALATAHFAKVYVNIFNANDTLPADRALIDAFVATRAQKIDQDPRVRVLIDNTELGVGD